jgi:integrase/recombinase XerD
LLFLPVYGRKGRDRRAGQGLLERAIYKIIRDRAREILGVRLSPHKLRHTYASYLLAGGAQLETIQRHLGHADMATTMIYLHIPQKRQDDEIARVFA